MLIVQFADKVIVHLRSHKSHRCLRCLAVITHAEGERMTAAKVEVAAGLDAALHEVSRTTLAVRVIGEKSIAHLAIALHALVAQAAGNHIVHDTEVLCIACPALHTVGEDGVVITELIALADDGIGMVEVVLQLVGTFSKRAERVVVGVVIRSGTKQIIHCLIMVVDVVSSEESVGPRAVLRQIGGQRSGQCQVQLIVVTLLNIVECILSVGRSLTVGIDELVEVDLSVALTASQILAGVLPISQSKLGVLHIATIPHIIEVARQTLVIVRLRILRVVVVELRAGIHAVLSEE